MEGRSALFLEALAATWVNSHNAATTPRRCLARAATDDASEVRCGEGIAAAANSGPRSLTPSCRGPHLRAARNDREMSEISADGSASAVVPLLITRQRANSDLRRADVVIKSVAKQQQIKLFLWVGGGFSIQFEDSRLLLARRRSLLDSPLEEDGFELAVPPRRERLWAATPGKHCRFGPEPVSGSAFRAAVSDWQRPKSLSQERDRWFESGSLQRRVSNELFWRWASMVR